MKNLNGRVHIYSIKNSQISANRAHLQKVSISAMDLLSNKIIVGLTRMHSSRTGTAHSRGRLSVEGCLLRGVSSQGVDVCLVGVYPGGVCRTPPVDRQMPVKILPCPKLRLRAVISLFSEPSCMHFVHTGIPNKFSTVIIQYLNKEKKSASTKNFSCTFDKCFIFLTCSHYFFGL